MMKKATMLGMLILFSLLSFSQKNELYLKAGSGFYFFSGNTVLDMSSIFYSVYYPDPGLKTYGKNPDLSLTGGLSFKRVTKGNFLFGAGAEYQYLSSRSNISMNAYVPSPASSLLLPMKSEGKVVFNGQFIALSPFMGFRFKTGKNSIDISAGPEFAFLLKGVRKTDIKSDPAFAYEKKRTVEEIDLDFRMQLQVEMNIKRMSIYTGYAKGITNYYGQMIGADPEAYSHFVRIGVGYKL